MRLVIYEKHTILYSVYAFAVYDQLKKKCRRLQYIVYWQYISTKLKFSHSNSKRILQAHTRRPAIIRLTSIIVFGRWRYNNNICNGMELARHW